MAVLAAPPIPPMINADHVRVGFSSTSAVDALAKAKANGDTTVTIHATLATGGATNTAIYTWQHTDGEWISVAIDDNDATATDIALRHLINGSSASCCCQSKPAQSSGCIICTFEHPESAPSQKLTTRAPLAAAAAIILRIALPFAAMSGETMVCAAAIFNGAPLVRGPYLSPI